MILIFGALLAVYVFCRAILPLKLKWGWKLLLAALLAVAAFKFHLLHLFGVTMFFSPVLPENVLLAAAWLFSVLFLFFFLLLAAVSLEVARVYGSRLPELRSKSQALDAQIQQTEKQNDVLRSDLEHEGDPDFIQGLARDDLGLASDGERIFYDVNN